MAAQHLVLVAQHQQLSVLGQVRADQHRQQAEQAPQQPVDERQQHPEMVLATVLIPQQHPCLHHETELPSGTRSAEASCHSRCSGGILQAALVRGCRDA